MSETQQYNDQLAQALSSIPEDAPIRSADGYIHLSTGVVLAPKAMSPLVFQSVASKFKDPKVPTTYIEEKGREEPNPMHPDYLAEVEETNVNRSMATIDAAIALGTSLVSVPEGFMGPDNDDWIEDLDAVGIVIDKDNKRMRYRTWVKFIAATGRNDLSVIISTVLSGIGVTEEAVSEAIAGFRHTPQGETPNPSQSQT